MKRLGIFLFCLCNTLQAQNLDSIWSVWENHSLPDTSRVIALTKFTRILYQESAPRRTLSLTDSVILFADRYDHSKSACYGYLIRGLYLNRQGEYQQALANYEKGVGIARKNNDTLLISNLYNNMANTYGNIGNFDYALVCYNYSIELSKLQFDTITLATGYLNIAEVYIRKGDAPKGLNALQQSLKISEMIEDEATISMIYMNMSSIYEEQHDTIHSIYYSKKALSMHKKLGMTYLIPYDYMSLAGLYQMGEKYDVANKYYYEAVAIAEQTGEKEILANAYLGLATNYKLVGNIEKSLKTLEKVLKLTGDMGNLPMLSNAHLQKGKIYLQQQKYSTAVTECFKSYQLSLEMKSLDDRQQSCECLAVAYDHLGDYKNSSRFYQEFITLKDSINTEAKIQEFTELRMQYDFDKEQLADSVEHMQEQSIKDLQIEKNRSNMRLQAIGLSFAGLGIILMITLAVVIYKGKKKSDELLLNILPYETAQELKKKGYSDAKQFDQVSVMFTDFKGFTGIAEKLSPQRLVTEINDCFKVFDQIMEKYGVEKIKTIGDAYMAACGLPVKNPENAVLMVKAALEIRDFMNKREAIIADDGLPYRFDIRIGINTGPVVAGIVGIKKFQYDIWGDTVNLASRMESSGDPGKVNISLGTYVLVKDHFKFEYRGEIEAKGKGPVQMYFVDWLN